MIQDKRLALLVRILILAATFGFILWKLSKAAGLWRQPDSTVVMPNPVLMIVALLMMPFNWLVEAFRWQKLAGKIQALSLRQAFMAVLAGIAMGLFTPRRIGDVGGRCLMMEPGKRPQGLLAFALGSLLQTSVTALFGALAVLMLSPGYLPEKQLTLLLVAGLSIITLLGIAITHMSRFSKMLLRISLLKKYNRLLKYFDTMASKNTLKIFLLGTTRYLIFTSQFYLLIRAFSSAPSLSMLQAYTGIALTYFLMTFVPLSSLAGLGIRGSTAVFVFSLFTDQTGGVVVATLVLWLINLALPAIAGAWIIGRATARHWKRPTMTVPAKYYKSF